MGSLGREMVVNTIQAEDLTAIFGSGNEPTKEESDIMFADYFEGTKSVTVGRARSVEESGTNETTQYLEPFELKSLPNGVKDEIVDGKLIQRVSDWYTIKAEDIGILLDRDIITEAQVPGSVFPLPSKTFSNEVDGKTKVEKWTETNVYLVGNYYRTDSSANNRYLFSFPPGTTLEQAREALEGTKLIYHLAEPIIHNNVTSGQLVSHPKGTVYFEHYQADVGVYDGGVDLTNADMSIKALESVSIIDFLTGDETYLDTSKAVLTERGFTHPELSAGDLVFFTYEFDVEFTNGSKNLSFYDSRYTVKDATTGKIYKWKVSVDNGTPSIELEEA